MPRKPDRSALLRDVCEHPDDNAPRLRFAEYLESTGNALDQARAELIRAQCEMCLPTVSNDRWIELSERVEVLYEHREDWTRELPVLPGVQWTPHLERGFHYSVDCDDGPTFCKHASAIFGSAPIQCLGFDPVAPLKGLLAVPELLRVRELNLQGQLLAAQDAGDLAMSPNAASITDLHLSESCLGDEGVRNLVASPYLWRLDNLNLGQNGITDAGVRELANAPILATLTHLGLAGNPLTNAGANALAASPHLNRLTGLTLWDCKKLGVRGKNMLLKRFGDVASFED